MSLYRVFGVTEKRPPEERKITMHVGDEVREFPITFDCDKGGAGKPHEGMVVWVHPKGRYHVTEFTGRMGHKVRECFWGA